MSYTFKTKVFPTKLVGGGILNDPKIPNPDLDKNNPKISIVLPTYNGERWLAQSIESVITQTEKNWELIIVNDCSKDNTLKIAESYAQQDQRICVFSNTTNKKLPATLNIGFQYACGKYLTWTSDDNLYKPKALEVMARYLDDNPKTDLVCADQDYLSEDGEFLGTLIERLPPRIPIVLLYSCNVGGAFMYRKTITDKIGKYDENTFCAEDYDYWCRIALAGTITYINDNLYQYRMQSQSLTVTKKNQVAEKTKYIREKYFSQFCEKFKLNDKERVKLLYLSKLYKKDERFNKYRYMFFWFSLRRRIGEFLAMFIFWNKPIRHKIRRNFGVQLESQ
ncbi:MAG: glycosyltransferase [Deltaproteobacteria bacterium]|jgi:glycosyltransferase involved in cell wall biosynthesis|nr:glycosyltransferase [Deltaproteobacteria bacterium]